MKNFTTGICTVVCLLAFHAQVLAVEIRLSAAASLKEVVNELADSYSKTNPSLKIVRNYGGSGALAKQILNGAPADIFIPASQEWLDYLKVRKLVAASTIGTFAGNALVFAGTGTTKVSAMKDLLRLKRIAIGSPKSVPAGEYAMAAMHRAGVEKQLEKKLVMARDARDCLMYAERGEVDGAFVYRTDALRAKQSQILFTVPQELYPRIIYPLALTVDGAKNGNALAFARYLQGKEARAVLDRHGFVLK